MSETRRGVSRFVFSGIHISFTEGGAILGGGPGGKLGAHSKHPVSWSTRLRVLAARLRASLCKATPKPSRQGPQKGGGAPKGAIVSGRACEARQRAYLRLPTVGMAGSARSPSGAPRRRSPERANAPAQSRPRFKRSRGCGRYPHHQSRLSQAPGTPVVMPEGSIPRPPGSEVTSPARRNRTRSINRLSPVDAPDMSEMGRGYCHRRSKVKGFKFSSINQGVSRRRFPQNRAPRV